MLTIKSLISTIIGVIIAVLAARMHTIAILVNEKTPINIRYNEHTQNVMHNEQENGFGMCTLNVDLVNIVMMFSSSSIKPE